MLRRSMAPSIPAPLLGGVSERKIEARAAEKDFTEDVFINRFMKNQMESRQVRAQAVSRIAKSALAATVSGLTDASAAEKDFTEDAFMNRFMKNQMEARSV